MRLTSPSVQRLLNASERTLVASASAAILKDLSAARLRGKVDRARALKDKYSDLARARGRAGRGKAQASRGTTQTDRETMAAKAEVFEVVLTRFTTQLARVEARAAKAAPRPRRATPRKASVPMTKGRAKALVEKVRARVAEQAGAPAAVVSDDPLPAATEALAAEKASLQSRSRDAKGPALQHALAATHLTRAQGHAGARTQRAQGKRDS